MRLLLLLPVLVAGCGVSDVSQDVGVREPGTHHAWIDSDFSGHVGSESEMRRIQ